MQRDWQPAEPKNGLSPKIIGHRGSGIKSLTWDRDRLWIGNTRATISAAIGRADWIEIDVRKTADRETQLVVFHDGKLDDRTKNGIGCVESKELAALKKCYLNVPNHEGKPEEILTLEEVFNEFHSEGRRWIIDIKSEGIGSKLLEVLRRYELSEDSVILFGDHKILLEYRGTSYPRGYTALFKTHRSMLYRHADVLERCENESYSYLVVPAIFVTPQLAADCASRDLSLWSYDSSDIRDLEYFVGCGVSGLIVDNPNEVSSHFGGSDGPAR